MEPPMDDGSILTVLASAIVALTSTKAWEYYSKRAQSKVAEKESERQEKNLYRDDLRREVERLREELKSTYERKERELKEFKDEINVLSQDLAKMQVRVEFLERENTLLREKLGEQPTTIDIPTTDR